MSVYIRTDVLRGGMMGNSAGGVSVEKRLVELEATVRSILERLDGATSNRSVPSGQSGEDRKMALQFIEIKGVFDEFWGHAQNFMMRCKDIGIVPEKAIGMLMAAAEREEATAAIVELNRKIKILAIGVRKVRIQNIASDYDCVSKSIDKLRESCTEFGLGPNDIVAHFEAERNTHSSDRSSYDYRKLDKLMKGVMDGKDKQD